MSRVKKTTSVLCRWAEDDDGNWDTDCGNKYVLIEGGPTENAMLFCCYCGALIHEDKNGAVHP